MKRWIIERICDELQEMIGRTLYVEELPWEIWQSENIDGSVLYSTYETRQWIAQYMEDIADLIYDYEDLPTIIDFSDAFLAPEKFMVGIVIYATERYFTESQWVTEHWGDRVELTQEVIDVISEQLKQSI